MSAMALPQLAGRLMVTDGGMETDLIFHHGVDLRFSPPSRWWTARRDGPC